MLDNEIRATRIDNTCGPCMLLDDSRAVCNITVHLFNGETLSLFCDGSQTLSFCYVDDWINGMTRLMNRTCIGVTKNGISSEFSIFEVPRFIRSKINPLFELIYKQLYQDEPLQGSQLLSVKEKYSAAVLISN